MEAMVSGAVLLAIALAFAATSAATAGAQASEGSRVGVRATSEVAADGTVTPASGALVGGMRVVASMAFGDIRGTSAALR